MSFLLDTDICSAHLKLPAGLTSRLVQHSGRLHISVLTLGELQTWAAGPNAPEKRRLGLEELLKELILLPIDRQIADTFAQLRSRQIEQGRLTPTTDLWIASTAITHGLTLVTHNTRDFEDVPGLVQMDWIA